MISKRQSILAILLVLSIALMAGCTGGTTANNTTARPAAENTVRSGDTVSVDYTGWLDNGTVFDTSDAATARQADIYNENGTYGPLSFTVGSGEVIEGFDEAVVGMRVNESRNVTLSPAKAYGEYDPALIQPVNMSLLLENNITPHVNDTLYYGVQPVTVHSIPNNTTVYIDFNDPMAGKTLHFTLTVRRITPAAANATADL